MKRSRKFDGKKLNWLRAGKEFAVLVVIAFLVFRFVIGVSFVSGNSMYPTLNNGQPVIYNRLDRSYDRGDIISVRMPNGEYLVKRIIAVEGDSVDIHDGRVWINGVLETDDWVNGETFASEGAALSYPFKVGAGMIFVMGDNREVSVDSREIGEIAVSQIRGKISG